MAVIEILKSVVGKNGKTLNPGTIRDFPEALARHLIERGVGRTIPPESHSCDSPEPTLRKAPTPDDAERLERIALVAEDVAPKGPRLFSNGVDLGVHAGDPPHLRVFAWCLVHLRTGEGRPVPLSKLAKECRISELVASESLDRLVKESDLVRFPPVRYGPETFKLRIQYPEKGTL